MEKKEYLKPAACIFLLNCKQNTLTGSYSGIQATSNDDDNPDYDDEHTSSIWDAY